MRYRCCGLLVDSELRLNELAAEPQEDPAPAPDVWIGFENLSLSREPPDGQPWPVCPDRCMFHVPGVGLYEARGGRELAIRPYVGAAPERVALFALGTGWSLLLGQRGALAMHAGVVAAGDGAVAFCGASRAGKSSAIAWLAHQGHRVLSDDLCRVELAAGGPALVWPSGRPLKLSGAAALRFGRHLEELEPQPAPPACATEKYLVACDGAAHGAPLPLRAAYLLGWGPREVKRLQGLDALRRFVSAATYRPQFLQGRLELAGHWRLCAELVRRVAILELTRPREWSGMEVVGVALAGALGCA